MNKGKFLSIFLFLVTLAAVLVVVLWQFILPEDIKDSMGIIRWRRNSDVPLPTPQTPPWMGEMIVANANRSNQRTSENILLNALGQLQISGPENIMAYISMQSTCATIRPYLKIFERNHKDLPDSQLFVRLFKAVEKFHLSFCGNNERYRRIFSMHEVELTALHEQFVDCEGEPDWYERTNSTTRCAEADNVVKCYGETLKSEIDESTARAYVCLLETVLNVAMVGPCNFTTVSIDLSFNSTGSSSVFTTEILFFTLLVVFML